MQPGRPARDCRHGVVRLMRERYIVICVILGMAAVMCGTVDAGVKLRVETQAVSVGEYPVCTTPCECITESTAAMRWGAQGYEKCSKTICGQDAGGDIQYYCIHQAVNTVPVSKNVPAVTVATATTLPAMVQETPANAAGASAAITATPSSAWPAADAVPKKTPVGMVIIPAAIGAALLVFHGWNRK